MTDAPSATQPGLTNWLLLCLLGLIWGASFMSVTIALETLGPFWVSAARIILGAMALLFISKMMGLRLPALSQTRIWVHVIIFGIFTNALPFALLSWGQTFVPSAFAGVTMAAVPLLVLPLAHFLITTEKMSIKKLMGFSLGFAGVLILIGWRDLMTLNTSGDLWPKLACIAAAGCYAIGSVNTRLCPPVPLMSFSAAGLLVAALISTPIAFYSEGLPSGVSQRSFLALIYLGLAPTALATVLLVRVITSAGPSFLSLVNYQVPIWSVVFGVVFLSEALPTQFLTALAVILTGLIVSQSKQRRFGRYPSG